MADSSSLRGLVATAVLAGGLLLAPSASAAEAFPVFTLPFETGQQVSSAGIHSDNGNSGVKNALDLSPRDGLVRAPLAGTVRLQHCDGGDWVTIDHAGGWRTGYYHLERIAVADGQAVEPGALLGETGNALPCGGSSSGAHVHFTLWTLPDGNARAADALDAGNWDGLSYRQVHSRIAEVHGEPVDGKEFGGWRFTEGAEQYSGVATHVADGEAVQLPGRFRYEAE
ncbi:M23 family metallopeptidase [Amycolatopsis sp. YIM 10]|uniref:M23 family metallopeptidase n=1 Tax=Amycolatopsis sp. YIM 10 TaxID=2653857 RepID=UPI0012901D94|nr:M23 family metallopeptidase [Amycolatopsis sp. YIM 10]QFU87990.1 Protease LasA precursor [Amycolatopsis sp. YIM 10]